MSSKPKISVIVPVCNVKKTLHRTLRSILMQDYENFEIILVENGSTDGTWHMLQKMAQKFDKIRIWRNETKGTTHARFKGIELAEGKYIVFIDGDDIWVNKQALSTMVRCALREDSEVIQFGYYKDYFFYHLYCGCREKRIIDRKTLLSKEIAGTMGANNFDINNYVWNKIYRADILKRCYILPEMPLVYSEDMYLNLCVMFDEYVNKICILPLAFTLYHVGIGISSGIDVTTKLLKEYNITKTMALRLAKSKGNITTYPIYRAHRESLYFYRALIISYIREKKTKDIILENIQKIEEYPFICEAKHYLSFETQEELEEETRFLAGKYTPEEYYDHCRRIILSEKRNPIKESMKRTIRLIYKGIF